MTSSCKRNKARHPPSTIHNGCSRPCVFPPGCTRLRQCMMTSSNGNIFRVTGHCAGNSPGPVNSPHKGQWRGALMFSLICAWINAWVNNREAGDLRRHCGHYDVNEMASEQKHIIFMTWYKIVVCSMWCWTVMSGIRTHPGSGSTWSIIRIQKINSF